MKRPRNLPPALLQRERELLALAERKALLDALASHALVFGAHARAQAHARTSSCARRGPAKAGGRSTRRAGCRAQRERVLAWYRSLPAATRAAVLTDDGRDGMAFARAVLRMRRRRSTQASTWRWARSSSRTTWGWRSGWASRPRRRWTRRGGARTRSSLPRAASTRPRAWRGRRSGSRRSTARRTGTSRTRRRCRASCCCGMRACFRSAEAPRSPSSAQWASSARA